jgi:hypothetical protein
VRTLRPTPALVCAGLTAVAAVLSGCSSATNSPTGSPVPAQGTGCVTQQQATQVWTQIDTRLNAIELDPKHAGTADVATGAALTGIRQYLQQQLVAKNLTEREVDHLQSLSVVDAGCNGGTLQLRVTMTLVQDDYLATDGHVDHADAQVGKTLHILDSYVRSGGVWKESDFQDLDQPGPTQTPQLV